MKFTKYLFAIAVLAFVVVGLNYANAWDNPPANPPSCPPANPGCNQPLNVSDTAQVKGNPNNTNGGLSLGRLIVRGEVFFPGGASSTTVGHVLTLDNVSGLAKWKPAGSSALLWKKGENCGGVGSYYNDQRRRVSVQCCADGKCAFPLEYKSGRIIDHCPTVNSGFVGVGDVGGSGAYFATCICNSSSCGTKN